MHNIGKLFTTAIILLIAVGCKVSSDGGSGDEKTDLKISATAGVYGKISPSGTVKVSYGANQSFTITADPNYQVLDVIVDGVSEGALTSYIFKNVKTNHTIQASFKETTYYTIMASAGYNGSISPSGSVTVAQGAIQTFTITADPNYQVLDVIVDGGSKGPLTNFTFTNVTKNHTIEANFDKEHQIITMGDSITAGFGDDLPGDDVSEDGKNSGGGFQPILNDLLTAYEKGFPHDVVNEGVGGDTSADGLALIPTVLSRYPNAKKYLLMYGTNDADPFLPIPSGKGLYPGDPGYPGTYKDNMQQMIDAINGMGKQVCLAKPPITLGDTLDGIQYVDPDTGVTNLQIKEYNQVIDELVNDLFNYITISPPSFYNYFKEIDSATGDPRYKDQFIDNLHPNGIGYQSMAQLWFDALTN